MPLLQVGIWRMYHDQPGIDELRFESRYKIPRKTGFPVNCQCLTHGWVSELGTYRKSDF
jgi:hypothetical protein